jgi:hypothetical protein
MASWAGHIVSVLPPCLTFIDINFIRATLFSPSRHIVRVSPILDPFRGKRHRNAHHFLVFWHSSLR